LRMPLTRCAIVQWWRSCGGSGPVRRSRFASLETAMVVSRPPRCCISCSRLPGWQALADEAARWQDAGRTADLWWRDDDAADDTPSLRRLVALQDDTSAPLALAVVPARATPALADRLAPQPGIDLWQQGYAHMTHAPSREKRMVLAPHRPAMVVLGELGTGWLAMERMFSNRALPVLVPPWNRIAPALVPTLAEVGFRGLSGFGRRR